MKYFKLSILIVLFMFSCNHSNQQAQLEILWQPIDHFIGGNSFFLSKLTIKNTSDVPLGDKGWTIYFNSLRRILQEGEKLQELSSQGISIKLADAAQSGDYYALTPLKNFKPILPGESREIDLYLANWAILKTDAPCVFHISFNGKKPQALHLSVHIDPKNPKQTMREIKDLVPVSTPELRFSDNSEIMELQLKDKIIPRPNHLVITGKPVKIKLSDIKIKKSEDLQNEANFLYQCLKNLTGEFPSEKSEKIILKLNPNLDIDNDNNADSESYHLQIKEDYIVITGKDKAGVFYGIQTFRQLISSKYYKSAAINKFPQTIEIPQVKIYDKPRFAYRGMMLDVARHFQTKETVKKLLDLLAFFKINTFHFHLNDDEGWRLEIPEIPELTEYGARRGFDLEEKFMQHPMFGNGENIQKFSTNGSEKIHEKFEFNGFNNFLVNLAGKGSGFYTIKDFEEILQFAAERHITVIPEVEMPAHCRAAIKSMEYRYRKYAKTDIEKAIQYRLIDPTDNSPHKTVQGYTDNFINPALPTTYVFLDTVIHSIKNRYDSAGVALTAIHGGGDELPNLKNNVWWQGSLAVQANPETKGMNDRELVTYFTKKYIKIINAVGAEMYGWSDLFHNADSTIRLEGFNPLVWNNVWTWGNEDFGYILANSGYKTVLAHATNLYLDLAYNKDPNEPGFYWADFVDTKKTFYYRPFNVYVNGTHDQLGRPIKPEYWADKEKLKLESQKNIIGIQAQLWGENQKVPEFIEYFSFPKILGFVERAWNINMPSEKNIDVDWKIFSNSLGQSILPILDFYQYVDIRNELPDDIGVKYRVPLPGAELKGGILKTNIRFPGLKVEYTKNNGKFWREWSKPAKLAPPVKLRTKTKNERYSRVVEIVD